MIRVVIFLALALAAALGVVWIADRPGQVVVTWLGRTVELDILTAIVAFLVAAVAMTLAWSLLRLVFRLPSLIAVANRGRRRGRGFEAVARGMVAVSAGDARTAQKQASQAQKLLGAEPLTLLLTAQSAQLSGESGKAEKAFNAMLERADTRVVGLRGLHIEANRKGDDEAARFYAEEAYKLAPAADWASDAALQNRARERDWLGAMALVEQAASRRLVDKDTARRQRAILLTADALDRGSREPEAALRAAQEAVKLAPGLAPAAAFLGRKLSEKGDYAKASRVLEAAWKQEPHPDVSDAYLDVRLGDAAQDRLKRARALQRLCPRDPESRLVVARAAIGARDFRAARENLETLVLEHPTVRACVLMAELEEAEHADMGLVREWLGRASRAPRDKAWVGDGRVSESWAPVSPSGRIGGYVWATPPQVPGTMLIEEIRAAPGPAIAAPAAETQPPRMVESAPAAEPARPKAEAVSPAVKDAPAEARPANIPPAQPVEAVKSSPAIAPREEVIPAKAAAAEMEPAKAETGKAETGKAETGKTEAVTGKTEAVTTTPAAVAVVKAAPAKVMPAKVMPAKVSPARTMPASLKLVEPAAGNVEGAKKEPVALAATPVEASKIEPAIVEPVVSDAPAPSTRVPWMMVVRPPTPEPMPASAPPPNPEPPQGAEPGPEEAPAPAPKRWYMP